VRTMFGYTERFVVFGVFGLAMGLVAYWRFITFLSFQPPKYAATNTNIFMFVLGLLAGSALGWWFFSHRISVILICGFFGLLANSGMLWAYPGDRQEALKRIFPS
jgi:hypothetical protein